MLCTVSDLHGMFAAVFNVYKWLFITETMLTRRSQRHMCKAQRIHITRKYLTAT